MPNEGTSATIHCLSLLAVPFSLGILPSLSGIMNMCCNDLFKSYSAVKRSCRQPVDHCSCPRSQHHCRSSIARTPSQRLMLVQFAYHNLPRQPAALFSACPCASACPSPAILLLSHSFHCIVKACICLLSAAEATSPPSAHHAACVPPSFCIRHNDGLSQQTSGIRGSRRVPPSCDGM